MPDKEKAMDKTLVVYGSHYGATKTYAEYIAQKLSCPCLAAESLKKGTLANCDTVVFGGGVYAGSIAGFGVDSYLLGLRAACSLLERKDA